MERLKSDYRKYDKPKHRTVENIIHNFSSQNLTPEEEHALSFTLDDHMPTKQNDIKIKIEFESFYYQILNPKTAGGSICGGGRAPPPPTCGF